MFCPQKHSIIEMPYYVFNFIFRTVSGPAATNVHLLKTVCQEGEASINDPQKIIHSTLCQVCKQFNGINCLLAKEDHKAVDFVIFFTFHFVSVAAVSDFLNSNVIFCIRAFCHSLLTVSVRHSSGRVYLNLICIGCPKKPQHFFDCI